MKVKDRQIAFLFFVLFPISKVLVLPSILVNLVDRDLYISAFISFMFNFLILALIFICIKRNGNTDFFTLLKDNFGQKVAKILFFIYALFFMIKPMFLVVEQRAYVETMLYETVSSVWNMLPFFAVSIYFSLKSFTTFGRAMDFAFFLFLITYVIIISLSVPNASFSSLLPVGRTGRDIAKTSLMTTFYFTDTVYMLFFMGKFENKKRSGLKIMGSYLIMSIMICFFLMNFYGVFQSLASKQLFAITKISKFSLSLSVTGRIDYFAIFLYLFNAIIAISLPIFLSTELLCQVFNFKKRVVPALITNGAVLILYLCSYNLVRFAITICVFVMPFIFIPLGFIIPALTVFLKRKDRNA